MTKRNNFRPTVQTLETRRCMAASLGVDAVSATPPEPDAPVEAATITDITISGNTANSEGGGLWNSSTGTMTITDTTIDGNTANARGGGIFNDGGTLEAREAPSQGQDGNDLLIVNNGDGSDFQEETVDEVFRQTGGETEAGGDSFRYTISDNLGQPSGD